MAIDAAAAPWVAGPYGTSLRQHMDAPFAELNQCGLFGVQFGVPLAREQHYWPSRSLSSKYGRQVPCRDIKGKTYGNGTRRFGAKRPVDPNPADELRWHCGVDLGGVHLDMVVACQSGTVLEMQTFHLGTWALMVQNDHNGLVFSYNELQNGSWQEFQITKGCHVEAGQPIGRLGLMGKKSSMLHFEIYQTGTTRTYSWKQAGSRPEALRDPSKYLLYLAAYGA